MDTRTGEIIDETEAKKRWEVLRKQLGWEEANRTIVRLPETFTATPKQKKTNKIGRNDSCPCGSGRKFKKCCLKTDPGWTVACSKGLKDDKNTVVR